MRTTDKDMIKWYVVGTHYIHKELKIRDHLRLAGFECFVPLQLDVVKVRDRVQRKALPAITGMIFVRTSVNAFTAYAERSHDRLFLWRSAYSDYKELLSISDYQMQRFIEATSKFAENVTYYKPGEVTLHEGELVEITLGSKTYEVEIKRVGNKKSKKLVVEIPDVTTAIIELTPDVVKLIKRKTNQQQEARRQQREDARTRKLTQSGKMDERRSKNLELDKKTLFDTAFHLLFCVPDKYRDEMEYTLMTNELRRIRERLLTFKGVTAALEGELALAMYLANVQLDIEVPEATERLKKAIDRLQPTSMLRKRMIFYLARLTADEATMQEILQETKTWNKLKLSDRQAAFMKEIHQIIPVI